MKVTYCTSPVGSIRVFTMANRVLTENLLRNDKLDVHFDYSILECYMKSDREAFASKDLLKHPYKHSPHLWKENLRTYLSTSKYSKIFGSNFKTDIILMSCHCNWFDYPFIAKLLNNGHRLVLGGPNFDLIRTPERVKSILTDMGVKQKYLDNFIIVKGVVDLSTDLYKIVDEWKNTTITENDFSTVWECERDYLFHIKNAIGKTIGMNLRGESVINDYNYTTFLLDNRCLWRKCAFCTFRLRHDMPFDRGVDPEIIAQNIINTTKRVDTNRIYFGNDYFSFNKKNKRIIDLINEYDDYRIHCYTGIQMLKNKRYLDNINRYGFKYLKVGLEAGTDFALSKLNKGYNTTDVDEAIEKMAKILDEDVVITLNTMTDVPQRSNQEIEENYDNLLRWRDHLREQGMTVNLVSSSYAIMKGITEKECVDNIHVKSCSKEECQSGKIKFLKEMRNSFGEEIIDERGDKSFLPFNRIGTDGKILRTDFEVLPEETLNKLFGEKWGWG